MSVGSFVCLFVLEGGGGCLLQTWSCWMEMHLIMKFPVMYKKNVDFVLSGEDAPIPHRWNKDGYEAQLHNIIFKNIQG